MVALESAPPLAQHYAKVLHSKKITCHDHSDMQSEDGCQVVQELPVIDLAGLNSGDERARAKCASEIAAASSEWGFFQVVNHGINPRLLGQMRKEQIELFNASFSKKSTCGLLNNSYRWGSPTAATSDNFSWSEAFHIPLTKISDQSCYDEFSSLRYETRTILTKAFVTFAPSASYTSAIACFTNCLLCAEKC